MDYFGEAQDPEREPQLKVLWPPRRVNSIESELGGLMAEALTLVAWRAPPIFIEDETWINAAQYEELFGEALTLREAITLQGIIYGTTQELFRRQMIVAREQGPDAKFADYLIACEVEGIDPIIRKENKQ